MAGESGKPTQQTRALNPNRRKQSRKVETVALKRLITIGRHPEHRGSRKPRLTTAFGRIYERRSECGLSDTVVMAERTTNGALAKTARQCSLSGQRHA